MGMRSFAPIRRVAAVTAAGALTLTAVHMAGGGSTAPASVPPDLVQACASDNPYAVTACQQAPGLVAADADRKTALVAFQDTAGDNRGYLLATMGQVGSVYGLAYDAR